MCARVAALWLLSTTKWPLGNCSLIKWCLTEIKVSDRFLIYLFLVRDEWVRLSALFRYMQRSSSDCVAEISERKSCSKGRQVARKTVLLPRKFGYVGKEVGQSRVYWFSSTILLVGEDIYFSHNICRHREGTVIALITSSLRIIVQQ